MNEVTVAEPRIFPMTDQAINRVRALEEVMRKYEQAELTTHHVIHGGMYARTITLCKGSLLAGALIRVPTLLVIQGHVSIYTNDETLEVEGQKVIPASAWRKQVLFAHANTQITMIFASRASSVEEAENEFTDEPEMLMSRTPQAQNIVTITKE